MYIYIYIYTHIIIELAELQTCKRRAREIAPRVILREATTHGRWFSVPLVPTADCRLVAIYCAA